MGWRQNAEPLARTAVHTIRERFQQRLHLPTTDRQLTEPTVYFLGSDIHVPSGGTRVVYRHCDTLRAAGIRSVVLHRKPGFRHTWFASDTEVRSHRDCALGPEDLLVVSEVSVRLMERNRLSPRHVVLNQSGHLSWTGDPARVSRHYRGPNRPLGRSLPLSGSNRSSSTRCRGWMSGTSG